MSIWTDLLGAEIKYYMAGDWKTRVAEAGTGTPLILLHGGGGHLEAFAKNILPLSQFFHVYAIDFLTEGLTAKPLDIDVTIHTQAEHVRLFMDAAGIERAHLAGESNGGAIAGFTAYEYPERTLSYVSIVGASLIPPEGKSEQERSEITDQIERTRVALDNPTIENIRSRLEWLFVDPSQATDELCETRARIWSDPDYQAYRRKPRTRRGGPESLWPVLPELGERTPVLYLWTEHNPGTHLSTAERACQITPGASLEVMRDCGHWPQWEKPEEFNQILIDFLAAQGA